MNPRLRLFFVALATLLASMAMGRAHGPYDSSSQLIILDGAFELNTTLGLDGAKQVLLNAGLSEAEAADALASRGPSTFHQLPADLAPRFFDVTAGGQKLKATQLRVIVPGLEVSFVATYPGTYAGEISVHASYFDGVPQMKPGAFLAMDENHNIKGSAALSASRREAAIDLGGAAVTNAPVQAEAPTPPAVEASSTASSEPVEVQADHSNGVWLAVAVVVLALLAVFGWRFRRKA